MTDMTPQALADGIQEVIDRPQRQPSDIKQVGLSENSWAIVLAALRAYAPQSDLPPEHINAENPVLVVDDLPDLIRELDELDKREWIVDDEMSLIAALRNAYPRLRELVHVPEEK